MQRFKTEPNGGVALEATTEGDLKDAVALLWFLDLAYVVHFVPDGRGGGITIVIEGVLTWLCVSRLKLEVFCNTVNNSTTASMDAPEVDATFEIGDIRGDFYGDPVRKKLGGGR